MKILHTADWHIGKQLHKMDLSEDLELFFDWLLKVISTEQIDLLLVSGDVFDQANPSQSALKQYYGFLKRMIGTHCKIIITGGNHDSAAVLNAPKAILGFLNIDVVGGAPEAISELFFKHTKQETQVVIAAVPFLRDKDIRKAAAGESYSDKIEQIRDGIQRYFASVNTHYNAHFEGLCFIVMGHLYVQGAHVSESMRDIQIGNQASVKGHIFGEAPNYVALGHIHKPYAVSGTKQVHYSGSPIALSFSEKAEVKQVNVITITGKTVAVNILPIPQFRHLVAFEGTLESVKTQLHHYTLKTQLVSLAEIIVNEPNENVQIRQDFDELQSDHDSDALKIIKSKLNFTNKVRGASEAFEPGISVADVTPMEMFEKRLQLDGNLEHTEELKNAFRQILEELNL
ncbi:exonuclease subunit SbcD [Subsaximicrobium wynnwilliamsii]|uniref:Nuclease SbcCD subunit D n=1 Tax=Subsaximicrobium wynnwilliamsii TaxID=291179 RepID=A0A5C6ZLR7_9FLAO|nr:exonuclease subunit SbcD [Subsaximicrobium wynnwilliamsii]TXD81647.1 exonuclease subunit SbcD [Subsaximicrobium wynnwilliamsii]TXD91026.1 exonuclease subunit SbcD [Subsaximicrobium wynnwilliamsii]TXE01095.1 exonuclease subunit SbcD [Subsaximicrobium wynnwilliamsii]